MKKKEIIQNEIKKLRKIYNLKSATESQKDKAWVSMLALQWVLLNEEQTHTITPAIICKPDLRRYELLK